MPPAVFGEAVTPLAANVCRATLVFQATAGGSIPVRAMNFGIKFALGAAEELRDKNERDGKVVDAELRDAFFNDAILWSVLNRVTAS